MRVALPALALFALPLAATAQNPVTNGGFETGPDRAPEGWGPVGQYVERVRDAHAGDWALRIERPAGPSAGPETGLNRAWGGAATGQGSMLSQTRGGIRFWYRVDRAAPDADVRWVVIPMGESSLEDTGLPRTTLELRRAPDGGWREGRLAYDYSDSPKVRWVHIGVRITGGPASLLIDDVEWAPSVGAVVQLARARVFPDPRGGAGATLSVQVRNVGDQPAARLEISAEAPSGVTARRMGEGRPLPPGSEEVVRWRLAGRLRAGQVRVRAQSGDAADELQIALAPRVEIQSVLIAPGLLRPGETGLVTATVRNHGTAWSPPVRLRIGAGGGSRLQSPASIVAAPIAPNGLSSVRWRLAAPPLPGAFGATVVMDDASDSEAASKATATAITTQALDARWERLAGPLGVRRGADRSVGELRVAGARLPAARMPHLGLVVVHLPDGADQTLVARYGRLRRTGTSVTATATAVDRAGGKWRFALRARPEGRFGVRLTLGARCTQPRRVRHFEGPAVLVGDGGTGPAKREAILPGLEWLTRDEVSSSDLDIAASHPDRVRFLPHPNKVTIPAMGVRTPAAAVGLLWAPSVALQPVFAVPDRLGGVAAHRLALALPSVANGRRENQPLSGRPLALAPGQEMRIEGVLIVDPSGRDALAALDHWSRIYRAQPPMPAPRGTDRLQAAWSMAAYTTSLWVSEKDGWRPFLGGPAIWDIPSWRPDYLYDLREVERIAPEHPDAPLWRSRASLAASRGLVPLAEDLGFAYLEPSHHISTAGVHAAELARSQLSGGGWPFDAYRRDTGVFRGMDYNELGPHGAVEVGTIALNAYGILQYARLTGDARAYRAGVRALRRLEGFEVPRAAQVWEVPVHTPDILATADAVDAFLEAYRFTVAEGHPEARWLAEARRWARAGLPFVYVWNAPGRPWMRHGSIPVFGATWFQGSWFGNIVQWNGLRYAYALWKLHAYDPSARFGGLSWRDLAVGITRSAMYQQSTGGKNLALWPDSLHTVTGARSSWEFPPRQILKNIYALMGSPGEPDTFGVRMGAAVARVSVRGKLVRSDWTPSASARPSRLSVTVRPVPGPAGRAVIAGIAAPASVAVNGTRIAQGGANGWVYEPSCALLSVPVRRNARSLCAISVEGVRGASPTVFAGHLAATTVRELRFEFDRGPDGWVSAHDLKPLRAVGGALRLDAIGPDPYAVRSNCRIAADRVREVVLRVKAQRDGSAQFFWTTETSPDWSEEKSIRFSIPADGQWHEVVVPVGDHPSWQGATITGLRIDPASVTGASAEVDWIRGR